MHQMLANYVTSREQVTEFNGLGYEALYLENKDME
jgi:hypothetical protein